MQIEEYAVALKGVEASQAALLLSTQGLTNAQIAETLAVNESNVATNYKAMAEAGLLKSKQKLTVAEIRENLQTVLGAEADTSATMTSLGLSTAIEGQEHQTVKLTTKKLQELVVTRALTEAQAQELAMRTGVTFSMKTQTASALPKWIASLKASALATWDQVKATIAWLATNPVGWCILAVTAIVTVTKAVAKYRENIIKAAEESKQAINDITDSYKNLESGVSSIQQRYAELAQGVDGITGKNKNLTDEDYKEFLDLSNQLAELFPQLTKGYDENGNAILNLSGDVNTIVSSLNNLLDVQRELANKKIIDELPDVLKGYDINHTDMENELEWLESWKHDLEVAYESLQDVNKTYRTNLGDNNDTGYAEITRVLSQLDIKNRTVEDENLFGFGTIEFEDYEDAIDRVRKALKDATLDFSDMNAKMASTNAEFNKYLNSWLSENWSYLSIKDSKLQGIVQDMLFNNDWMAEAKAQGIDTSNWKKLSKWIEENYINAISNIEDDNVKEALIDLYSLPDNNISAESYIEQIQNAREIIQAYCNEHNVEIPIKADDKVSDIEGLIDNVKEKLQDEFDDKVGELTFEDLQIAAEHIELDGDASLSWDELLAKISEYKETVQALEQNTPTLSSTIDQLNTQLKPAFDSLRSAYQNIFTSDGFKSGNVDISTLDSIRSKLEELNGIDGISIDYESFYNLARILADTSATEEQVHEAFNLFATDIVDGLNPALSDCSGENYKLIQTLLESAGIMNAEEVMVSSLGYAYEDYTAAKKECADEGIHLEEKSEQEIEALVTERLEANNCGQALALLQLKKALCNETALNPGTDIKRLYQLAKAAGIATEKIAILAGLNDAYEREAAAGNTPAAIAIMHKMEQVKADVEKQFTELGNVQVEFDVKDGNNSSSKAAEKAEMDWKNLLDKEITLLEKQLDAGVITFREYIDKRRDLIEDYYRDGKIAAEDYYDALEDMYDNQLSLYDRAVNAVTDSIDDEIDRLKDQQDVIKKYYQVKIDAIQEEIDALTKANDARKKQIDLEKAQYDAERARNQRVNKVNYMPLSAVMRFAKSNYIG